MSTDQLQCLHTRVYIVFACNNTLMTVLPRPLLLSPQVKLWNTSSGFCFVTFSEHTSAVTGVCFSASGKVVLSASLDGTVRAFDLHRCVGVLCGCVQSEGGVVWMCECVVVISRYRNFRTFASPRPVQFSCLTLDPSGEVVCAGSHDTFEIFVWSMQTGRLLDVSVSPTCRSIG